MFFMRAFMLPFNAIAFHDGCKIFFFRLHPLAPLRIATGAAFEKALSALSPKLQYRSHQTEKEHCKIALALNICNVATLTVARFFFFGKFPIPPVAFLY